MEERQVCERPAVRSVALQSSSKGVRAAFPRFLRRCSNRIRRTYNPVVGALSLCVASRGCPHPADATVKPVDPAITLVCFHTHTHTHMCTAAHTQHTTGYKETCSRCQDPFGDRKGLCHQSPISGPICAVEAAALQKPIKATAPHTSPVTLYTCAARPDLACGRDAAGCSNRRHHNLESRLWVGLTCTARQNPAHTQSHQAMQPASIPSTLQPIIAHNKMESSI